MIQTALEAGLSAKTMNRLVRPLLHPRDSRCPATPVDQQGLPDIDSATWHPGLKTSRQKGFRSPGPVTATTLTGSYCISMAVVTS